jgi:hypothetical protein
MRPPSDCQNNNDSNNVGKKFADSTGMLTRGLAEPYCGPGTMVKEGGVPANFR